MHTFLSKGSREHQEFDMYFTLIQIITQKEWSEAERNTESSR